MAQDEVFGPIAPIARFKDIDEVVRFVNARYSWTHAAATWPAGVLVPTDDGVRWKGKGSTGSSSQAKAVVDVLLFDKQCRDGQAPSGRQLLIQATLSPTLRMELTVGCLFTAVM